MLLMDIIDFDIYIFVITFWRDYKGNKQRVINAK